MNQNGENKYDEKPFFLTRRFLSQGFLKYLEKVNGQFAQYCSPDIWSTIQIRSLQLLFPTIVCFYFP